MAELSCESWGWRTEFKPRKGDEARAGPAEDLDMVSGLAVGATLATLSAMPAPAHDQAPAFEIAQVTRPIVLHSRPHGPAVARVGAWTEFGSRQTLGVVKHRGGWLAVVSTTRPNGRLGWIRSRDVRLTATRVSLTLDLSRRRLVLRQGDKVLRRMTVGVGRPGSPTPTGRFAVTDKLRGGQYGPYYGCCILALSAHQPRLPAGWTGGNRIAIHGTNAAWTIGAASSAGCAHARDADLRVLMRRVPLGTPVFIRA